MVLEAAGRIGGRAWTAHPPELGGVWFDMGAVWLHNAETNPLVPIAQAAGETLLRSDELRRERTLSGTREATRDEYADFAAAWDRYEVKAGALLREVDERRSPSWHVHARRSVGGDSRDLGRPDHLLRQRRELSLRDWHTNVLSGSNLVPDGGIGAFVARQLREGARHPAPHASIPRHLGRTRRAGRDPTGTITARSGSSPCPPVAAAGGIGSIRRCHLPPGGDPRNADGPRDEGRVARHQRGSPRPTLALLAGSAGARSGDPTMAFQCWPYKRDYIQGWIGGPAAWDLARAGDAAALDFALGQLRSVLRSRVDRVFTGGSIW